MGIVAPRQRIASAFVVLFGKHGAVTRQAHEQEISRQRLYRESAWVLCKLEDRRQQEKIALLQDQVHKLKQEKAELERRLAWSVELNQDKQAEFASVGQAEGVSLSTLQVLLSLFLNEQTPSVAKLGRWTKAAGERSAALAEVLDEFARPLVRQGALDEIYVKAPVLMVVEPESMCWLSGKRSASLSAEAWTQELRHLPALEQVTRDGGIFLQRGVKRANAERVQSGLQPLADQLDHFHSLRRGAKGVRQAEAPVWEAIEQAEAAEKIVERQRREGVSVRGSNASALRYWEKANRLMEVWEERERAWQKTKEALQLFTPQGELNTRPRAEAILAETLAKLPDKDFAKSKHMLQRRETLTFLDEVQRKLQQLPVPEEIRQAAVRCEGLRRRAQELQGDSPQAGALRGLLLVCNVILSKAGPVGEQAIQGVRTIFRNTWRASSLVECINSVLRMQQSRHRVLTQGLLNLKRVYWNCRRFRTGRRRGKSPLQHLGLNWPKDLKWWDMLKLTPEQLRQQLSAVGHPA
jgi:hypothetical protein